MWEHVSLQPFFESSHPQPFLHPRCFGQVVSVPSTPLVKGYEKKFQRQACWKWLCLQGQTSQARQKRFRSRKGKNVNVLLPAQQASSTPSQALVVGPSPRQQAAEKREANEEEEEEPIGKQDNTTDTQAPANTQSKVSFKDVLTNRIQKTPCEKGVSTRASQCKATNLRRQAWQSARNR